MALDTLLTKLDKLIECLEKKVKFSSDPEADNLFESEVVDYRGTHDGKDIIITHYRNGEYYIGIDENPVTKVFKSLDECKQYLNNKYNVNFSASSEIVVDNPTLESLIEGLKKAGWKDRKEEQQIIEDMQAGRDERAIVTNCYEAPNSVRTDSQGYKIHKLFITYKSSNTDCAITSVLYDNSGNNYPGSDLISYIDLNKCKQAIITDTNITWNLKDGYKLKYGHITKR